MKLKKPKTESLSTSSYLAANPAPRTAARTYARTSGNPIVSISSTLHLDAIPSQPIPFQPIPTPSQSITYEPIPLPHPKKSRFEYLTSAIPTNLVIAIPTHMTTIRETETTSPSTHSSEETLSSRPMPTTLAPPPFLIHQSVQSSISDDSIISSVSLSNYSDVNSSDFTFPNTSEQMPTASASEAPTEAPIASEVPTSTIPVTFEVSTSVITTDSEDPTSEPIPTSSEILAASASDMVLASDASISESFSLTPISSAPSTSNLQLAIFDPPPVTLIQCI